jgi:alanine racemase
MTRPAVARINLAALQHNFTRVQQSAPDSKVMAVIKANAYGHGLVPIAQSLADADAFGVACLNEAISLREAGFSQRIVLLEGLFDEDDLALIHGYQLDVVIHHLSQVEILEQGQLAQPVDVWLKIDTGMNRLGFSQDQVATVVERLQRLPQLGSLSYISHFACADEQDNPVTQTQLDRFGESCANLTGERSLANSAAVLAWPASHGDWVRPGIMLYGASPLSGETAQDLGLQAVMTLATRLIAVNPHNKGDAVGYGGDWVCPEDMQVGVAAMGYGDGYPRHAPIGTPLLVNG